MFSSFMFIFTLILWAALTNAHLAAWHDGMFCRNGPQATDDENASAPVTPLYMLTKSQWWFHHVDGCDQFPPSEGKFLELPAGKEFTVEISANRATTTLSYDGRYISDWVDGQQHNDAFRGSTDCITDPNIHTQNETMAAGTAFAISYQSDLSKVTSENLVVFSVRHHTPWKRLTSYSVPSALPACPPGGCICAWGWVPNGCGQPNIYHQGFRCKVTGATSTAPVAVAKPAVWCEDDASKCTKGAKQMVYWNQLDGNNVQVSGNDLSGHPKSPGYNQKLGFIEGAQNDIFAPPSQGGPAGAGVTSSQAGSSGSSSSSAAPAHEEPVPTSSESASEPTATKSESALEEPTTTSSESESQSALAPMPTTGSTSAHNLTTTARATSTSSIKPPAAGATEIPAPASGGASAGSGQCHVRTHSHSHARPRSNGTRSFTTPASKRGFASHHRRHRRGARIDSTSW